MPNSEVTSHVQGTTPTSGRIATKLAAELRTAIQEGAFKAGEMLPTERELSAKHGLAVMTVRRALRSLEAEGLLAVVPRRGCRVLAAANDPLRGCPLAHLHAYPADEALDGVQSAINLALQTAAARRGWSTLSAHLGGRGAAEVLDGLRTARAWGLVLEATDPGLLELVGRSGLPAVMVNAWSEGAPFDVVLQDNYQGGYLAAAHLLSRGHRRIAWLGPVAQSSFSRERLGGAAGALAAAGLPTVLDPVVDTVGRDLEDAALELLSRPDRPKAVLALWTDVALALAAAARKLGLVPGRDLDVVGWALEAHLEKYRPAFAGGPVSPMVVWRVEDLARAAVARLAERRADPEMPAMRIAVGTRLVKGDAT